MGADKDAISASEGFCALHFACKAGHGEVVRALLEKGADTELRTSDDGDTPLCLAAVRGHDDIVRALLGAGARVSALTSSDLRTIATEEHVAVLIELLPLMLHAPGEARDAVLMALAD